MAEALWRSPVLRWASSGGGPGIFMPGPETATDRLQLLGDELPRQNWCSFCVNANVTEAQARLGIDRSGRRDGFCSSWLPPLGAARVSSGADRALGNHER